MALVEVQVPDIGDFKDVEIIEVLVKPGETVTVDQSLLTVESDKASMETAMPDAFKELTRFYTLLEKHYRDMQDMEFTIEEGKLFMLQTRNGKRTARAAIKIAVDMAKSGLITQTEALGRVTPDQVDMLLHPQFSAATKAQARKEGRQLVSKAVNASPGAAVGMAVFDADTAAEWGKAGKAVIMVRPETKPDDLSLIHISDPTRP